MKAILIMELRGFEALALSLAKEAESVGLTSERVRASATTIMNALADQVVSINPPEVWFHLGGDTWYFHFGTLDECLEFAARLCAVTLHHSTKFGTFFLKPSLAINMGKPKLDGKRFYDDDSILAYRFADKGSSFAIRLVGNALAVARHHKLEFCEELTGHPFGEAVELDWQSFNAAKFETEITARQTQIPHLLLDSDVQYTDGTKAAVDLMLRQQDSAQNVLSFGGPAPISDPLYRNYIRHTIASLKADQEKHFTILSYIPLDEPASSFAWLELCRRLHYSYPTQFAFAAFPIPQGQLRPFSYHVYDGRDVYVGLRSYSPQRGTATLSAGIVFRTHEVALRFREEIHENFRKVGAFTDEQFASMTTQMVGLGKDLRKTVLADVDAVLSSP